MRNASSNRLVRLRSRAAAIRPCISVGLAWLAVDLLARVDKALAAGDQLEALRPPAYPGPLAVDTEQFDRAEHYALLLIHPLHSLAAGGIQAEQRWRRAMWPH